MHPITSPRAGLSMRASAVVGSRLHGSLGAWGGYQEKWVCKLAPELMHKLASLTHCPCPGSRCLILTVGRLFAFTRGCGGCGRALDYAERIKARCS
jgi:hypothetical protein